jgi:hypothetical protein
MLNMNILTLIIIIMGVCLIGMALFLFFLYKKIKKLSHGSSASSLEGIIMENQANISMLLQKGKEQGLRIDKLEEESLHSLKNVGVVRFNPFKEVGGSQSFALAFLNKKRNGVVISSLYARDRVNIFAKPIHNGGSEYTLSKEEQEALAISQKNL